MEVRIVVLDAESADALARQLTVDFGPGQVSQAGATGEIGIELSGDSDRAVVRILDAVQGWFDRAGAGSAELRLGTNSYRLRR